MSPSRHAARRPAAARPATLVPAFAAALAAAFATAAPAAAQTSASSTVGNTLVSRPALERGQGRVTVLPFAFAPAAVGGRVRSFSFVSAAAAQGEGGGDPVQITPLLLALTGPSSYTVVGRGTTRVLSYAGLGFFDEATFTFDFGLLGGSDLVTASTRVGFAAPYFQRGVVLYCDGTDDAPCADGEALGAFALGTTYGSADYPRAWIDSYDGRDLNAGGPRVGDEVAVAESAQRAYSIQFTADNVAALATVPEPGTVALLGAGLAGVALVGRRRGAR